ncbi:type IV toxin-antitoxin system AbiEi family antitoxin domain-containing protein [Pseudonocardia sp.]|uniref:type IV toxin-antitoxin system AbiEi family antitoxin domain-containing protein n=1 Tax=Pseudonocardia sp. TaxID=60912 RepID=UPI002603F88D|nr:type IV toxin-antitoxin system AbiEi family antitoxin domain-containing protein [Pseudonocardia sp.]
MSTFDQLVARQGGVVALWQAVEHGMTAATVHRRARSGAWLRLHPGVYLIGGHRFTDEVRVRAAWLWAGPAAAVTGCTAAWWHGMRDRLPEDVELTVPAAAKPRPQPGVRLRRRDLSGADLVVARDVRVAEKPFAALETAAAVWDGPTFLDRALQQHVRFPALYRSFCRNMGRDGSSEAGRLITAAADRADSAAERLLVKLLRQAGIGGWVLGFPFGQYRIDLAFPARRLAIEVDGWAWHVDAERFRNDRRKGNAITRATWDLLRFTWHDLDGRPAQTLREITDTLAMTDA